MTTSTKRRTVRRAFASTAATVFAAGALLFGVAQPASATVYPGAYLQPVSGAGTSLDIWGADNSVGARLGSYQTTTGWNQRFDLLVAGGGVQIRSQNGLCLKVGGYQPNIGLVPIVTDYCNAGDRAQVWTQVAVVSGGRTLPGNAYKNLSTGNCLDATSGTWVVDFPCHWGDNQRWNHLAIDWR